jgi:hypothetical protein
LFRGFELWICQVIGFSFEWSIDERIFQWSTCYYRYKNNNKRLRGGLDDAKGYNFRIKWKNKVDLLLQNGMWLMVWEDFNSVP